ncbi:MAG: 2,3-bisphosphoglycerate-independent phosphoglycerate mutase [Proteobacteria bacterium]|nr:2,3-bisphosphoglycerate-independent phosphoglycerate mutase [Pseudomonadota bacterium]
MSARPSPSSRRPVLLCVLDGWGYREERADNAVLLARTPNFDRLWADWPRALLRTSGEDVGLPAGQMGNSEVGHMNLGAGRIVLQTLPRIDAAIKSGELAASPVLARLIAAARDSGGACHVLGLLSPGGVHSHQEQMAALARLLDEAGIEVRVHAFLDGRDAPPESGAEYLERFLAAVKGARRVRLATVTGRYYAMDRDRRWDRTERAWRVLVAADAPRVADPLAAIRESYAKGVSDEFVEPVAVGDYAGMRDGDALLVANFRADRVRQILAALLDPGFEGFARGRAVRFARAVGMVKYSDHLDKFLETLFPPKSLRNVLGEVVAKRGLKQLRIAETEKYPHVTFFLNGGEERLFAGEERILVPSPKVATYDLKPEMSAAEVTDRLVAAIGSGAFDLIVANYANPDMVGHTGSLEAAIRAVEAVDGCLGRVLAALAAAGGAALVTADHGNCEMMRDPETGGPHTAHTLNPVPAVLFNGPAEARRLSDGRLADVAPTLLSLLGVAQPAEMTGRSLLIAESAKARRRARR